MPVSVTDVAALPALFSANSSGAAAKGSGTTTSRAPGFCGAITICVPFAPVSTSGGTTGLGTFVVPGCQQQRYAVPFSLPAPSYASRRTPYQMYHSGPAVKRMYSEHEHAQASSAHIMMQAHAQAQQAHTHGHSYGAVNVVTPDRAHTRGLGNKSMSYILVNQWQRSVS